MKHVIIKTHQAHQARCQDTSGTCLTSSKKKTYTHQATPNMYTSIACTHCAIDRMPAGTESTLLKDQQPCEVWSSDADPGPRTSSERLAASPPRRQLSRPREMRSQQR